MGLSSRGTAAVGIEPFPWFRHHANVLLLTAPPPPPVITRFWSGPVLVGTRSTSYPRHDARRGGSVPAAADSAAHSPDTAGREGCTGCVAPCIRWCVTQWVTYYDAWRHRPYHCCPQPRPCDHATCTASQLHPLHAIKFPGQQDVRYWGITY